MGEKIKVYTKEELIEALREIKSRGFVEGRRHGNAGSVGNTLEDLLGIAENNLAIANSGEWEIKAQRVKRSAKGTASSSLKTLFHMEPSPRNVGFVSKMFLPNYGWEHKGDHGPNERSFRQTLNGATFTDRGFKVKVDRKSRRVLIAFDASKVAETHKKWLAGVEKRVGLGPLNPQPYWGFDDLRNKAGVKLLNCVNIGAEVKRIDGVEHFHYSKIEFLSGFDIEKFLDLLVSGEVKVDFDARTGHNHGTKFRVKPQLMDQLYASKIEVVETAPE